VRRKVRLDTLLVERGLAASRTQARALILAGRVRVAGEVWDKPGAAVSAEGEIEVQGPPCRYVSRGGLKLEHALEVFDLKVQGFVCVDVGASTGGFTDCLLQHGARKVYAVDVGHGQLDWKLRQDPRVVVLERTNARFLQPGDFAEPVDLATVDVSFISLTQILPAVAPLLSPAGQMVTLIKPQFEAGRSQVGKGGVVREAAVHRRVLETLWDFAEAQGWIVRGLTASPVRGPRGNREFWLWLRGRSEPGSGLEREAIAEVVAETA